MQTSIREFAFADLQGFQRDSASFHPLFFTPARFRNSRISAAKAMPLAADFLQKQQKQQNSLELPSPYNTDSQALRT